MNQKATPDKLAVFRVHMDGVPLRLRAKAFREMKQAINLAAGWNAGERAAAALAMALLRGAGGGDCYSTRASLEEAPLMCRALQGALQAVGNLGIACVLEWEIKGGPFVDEDAGVFEPFVRRA